jgi:hypothetical protein
MLNSGKKIRALRDKKKILTLVLSEKNNSKGKKTHNPLQVKWSVPKSCCLQYGPTTSFLQISISAAFPSKVKPVYIEPPWEQLFCSE